MGARRSPFRAGRVLDPFLARGDLRYLKEGESGGYIWDLKCLQDPTVSTLRRLSARGSLRAGVEREVGALAQDQVSQLIQLGLTR